MLSQQSKIERHFLLSAYALLFSYVIDSAKWVAKEISNEMRFKILSISHQLTFDKTILLSLELVSSDWTFLEIWGEASLGSHRSGMVVVAEAIENMTSNWKSCFQLLLPLPPCRYDENLETLLPKFRESADFLIAFEKSFARSDIMLTVECREIRSTWWYQIWQWVICTF